MSLVSSIIPSTSPNEEHRVEISKVKRINFKLKNEIIISAQKKDLNQIQCAMLQAAKGMGKVVSLILYGKSLNPVTKLPPIKYFKKVDLENQIQVIINELQGNGKLVPLKNIQMAFEWAKNELTQNCEFYASSGVDVEPLKKQIVEFHLAHIANLKGDCNQLVLREIINKLEHYQDQVDPEGRMGHVQTVISCLVKYLVKETPIEISKSPMGKLLGTATLLFDREEVLSHIRVRLAKNAEEVRKICDRFKHLLKEFNAPRFARQDVQKEVKTLISPFEKENTALLNVIRKINASKEHYFTKNDLDKSLIPGLTQYINEFEYLTLAGTSSHQRALLGILQTLPNHLQKTKGMESYAFKTGVENIRERLAARSTEILQLDSVLLRKYEVSLPGTNLKGQVAPTGLASKWLTEEGQTFPSSLWNEYIHLKKTVARARYTKQKELPQLENQLQQVASKLQKIGSQDSIQRHCLIDLLYCTQDSHTWQYKMDNAGVLLNYDFSRFLAPSEVGKQDDMYFAVLRSAFLDHPVAAQPLSPDITLLIKSWDIEKIGRQHRQAMLVGDDKQFDAALTELKLISSEADLLKLPQSSEPAVIVEWQKKMRELCQKYKVVDTLQPLELIKQCKAKMGLARQAIKEKCFTTIHPIAFSRFCERISRAKNYINTIKTPPTVEGLRDAIYPNFKPFFKVLERIAINPGQTISMSEDSMSMHDLDNIIQQAKQDQLALPEEIAEMQAALEKIKKEEVAFDSIHLHLMMDS